MAGWPRRFVEGFAERVEPLQALLTKALAMERTQKHSSKSLFPLRDDSEEAQACRDVIDALSSAPSLVIPKIDRQKLLVTDASATAVGAALFQKEVGGWHPCGFMSKTLPPAARNYKVVELEAFAIVSALAHWEIWLRHQHFTLISDHRAVQCLVDGRHAPPSARLLRWAESTADFNFTLRWLPGDSDWLALSDRLSRTHPDRRPSSIAEWRALMTMSNPAWTSSVTPNADGDNDMDSFPLEVHACEVRFSPRALKPSLLRRHPHLRNPERAQASYEKERVWRTEDPMTAWVAAQQRWWRVLETELQEPPQEANALPHP